MVFIDSSTRQSYVNLLSTRNHAFSELIAQIIRLKENFPNNRIQSIRMDNASEFRSKAFDDYLNAGCLSLEMDGNTSSIQWNILLVNQARA